MTFLTFILQLLQEYGPAIVTAFIAWLIRKFEKPKAIKAARMGAFNDFLAERPDLIEAVNKHLSAKKK
jgi:hypothetical protein